MILSLREREFTQTAILSGTGTLQPGTERIHALCHAADLLDPDQQHGLGDRLEITLAILGLVNMNIPTLGTMLNWAISYQAILLDAGGGSLTPVVLSVLLFVALYWLSVSISEYLDPRTRIQRVGA